MPEKKRKYESALAVSEEFDRSGDLDGHELQRFFVRGILGIWRELDTLAALAREKKTK